MRSRYIPVWVVSLLLLSLAPSSLSAGPPDLPVGRFGSDTVEEPILPDATIGLDDPASVEWMTPLGWSDGERLDEIVLFSNEGHAIKYTVDDRALADGGRGIDIVSTSHHAIPEGVETMLALQFRGDMFLALAGDTLYELGQSDLVVTTEVSLDLEPAWHSNLWNRWSVLNTQGELLFAVANETAVGLYAKIPPNPIYGEFRERRFYEMVSLDDFEETRGSKVVGDPIVLNVPLVDNGSLIVVPTDRGVAALHLDYKVSGSRVASVSIGGVVWYLSYSATSPFPIVVGHVPDRPIAIASEDPREHSRMDRIFLVTDSSGFHQVLRENGTLEGPSFPWSGYWSRFDIQGIWPDGRGNVVATITADGDGLVTVIDADTGKVAGNGSYYHVTPSPVTMRPIYIPSSRDYVLNTEDGTVYILSDRMGLEARFRVPGGLVTDVGYVGNIVNNVGSSQGNYLAAVTGNTTLWVQSVTGNYLPPDLPEPDGERFVVVTDMGNITIGLFANGTPRTTAFFESLVENGTYADVPIDFLVQEQWFSTGDPGGSWRDIPNEGTALALPHQRGAVSMITHGAGVTGPELVFVASEWGYHEADGANAVFAVVVDGMDVVDAISELSVDGENRPVNPVLIEKVVLWKAPGEGRPDGDSRPEGNSDWIYISLIVVIVGLILLLVWMGRRA